MYITGATYWEINWEQAVYYFGQLAAGWPSMWDSASNMNSAERYRIASMRYGDELFDAGKYCKADEQYAHAQTMGALDQPSAKNAKEAHERCYPPTPTPTPTLEAAPTPTP
jgi:hypothetical protein